jgi:Tol biopolymer transport system component
MAEKGSWASTAVKPLGSRLAAGCTSRLFVVLLAAAGLPTIAQAADLASVGIFGRSENGASSGVAVNTDGSAVVFFSDASLLVPGDTNQARDVFIRIYDPNDPNNAQTERVSVSGTGAQANRGSHLAGGAPAVNGDGNVVAFYSDATNLVAAETNGERNVYVHFRDSGATELVSVGLGGAPANGPSLYPSISADGRFVAFQSQASNLVAGDNNSASDIFVRDLVNGTTEVVCGVFGDKFSSSPAISDDGNWVAFASGATNLVLDDTNRFIDIFLCNRGSGAIERVSVPNDGGEGNGDSILPAISADGGVVGFKSLANNLVESDNNNVVDVFVRDRNVGATERISVSYTGDDGNDFSFPPSLSDNGRFVGFGSHATNLVRNDINHTSNVFVRDRQIGRTLFADTNDASEQANNGTPDLPPAVSGDGKKIGFVSFASNLAPGDGNVAADVFIATNPFFGPGTCPDGVCPEGLVCVDGFCVVPTATPTPTRTQPPTSTGTPTRTPTQTPTFRPCMTDEDCPPGEKCRGGFCRKIRECDPTDPEVDLLACFERETCVDDECECGGDCNLDGYVFTNEITKAVRILMGLDQVSSCTAADVDLDMQVMGNEITLAVLNLGDGCLQEGRPLIFAHDRQETVTVAVRSETSGATANVAVDISGGLGEVGTVQLDLLYDPNVLQIADPSSACVKDPRLEDLVLLAAEPRTEAADGLARVRLFIGSTTLPIETITDGHVVTCNFDIRSGTSGQTAVAPDRLNVGDTRGNTFRVVASDGTVELPVATPTPGTGTGAACAGDCDRNGEVLGNEITRAILVMAGDTPLGDCPSADADGDGAVWVTDVTRAVINMGLGCP